MFYFAKASKQGGEEKMNNLITEITQNAIFVLEFLGVVVVIFIAARMIEKWERKRMEIRNVFLPQEN